MDNLKLQEKVVEEMTIPSFNYDLRKNFLKFFRKNMLSIREEMYQEFKNHISDSDYDLYFRKAISMYENGN
jgi:glutamate formiminotransferase